MSDEELHIKIKVDSSEAETKLGNIKDDFQDGAKGAGEMNQQTQMLSQSLSRLTGLNIGKEFFNPAVKNQFKAIKTSIKDTISGIKTIEPPLKSVMSGMAKSAASVVKSWSNAAGAWIQKTKLMLSIASKASTPKDIVKGVFSNFSKIKKVNTDYQNAKDNYSSAKNNAKDSFAQLKDWGKKFKDVFKQGASELGYGLKKLWNGDGKDIIGLKFAFAAIQVALILKTIKKIKQTIQEINNLWQNAIQQNLSTQYQQQIEYLKNYLGVTQEQLQTLLDENNEEIKALLKRQAKLGGVATNDQINAVKKLNQATVDLKEAWSDLWYNISATLAPVFEGIVKAITWTIALFNQNLSADGFTDEYVNSMKKMWEYSEAIKKNLMGFDELNVLGSNSSVVNNLQGGASEMEAQRAEIEAQYQEDLAKDKEYRKQKISELQTFNGESIDALGEWWDSLLSTLQNKINALVEKFKNTKVFKVINLTTIGLVDTFVELFKNVINLFVDIIGKVGLVIGDIGQFLAGLIESIVGVFKGIFKKDWSTALQGLKDMGKGVVNIFVDVFNALISAINTIITQLGELGVGKYKIKEIKGFDKLQIPEIPRLAKGGAVYQPTTAIIGEYAGARSNPEIVAPQSIMYETVKNANGDIIDTNIQLARQIIQAISQKDLSVSIGDKDVAEATNRYNNQYRRMTGKALLTI